jgi:gliding motility-associated-like protein/uncharacterized repeat protein (TIGR01451 family)
MLKKAIILSICLSWYAAAATYAQVLPPRYTRYIRQGEWVTLVATATNATSYQWYLNDQPISGAVQQQYLTGQPGTYVVEAYNSGGCVSERSDPISIVVLKDNPDSLQYADLEITKRADTKPVLVNNSFNYYLTALNRGPANASSVLVTDVLPKALRVESIQPPLNGDASYDAAAHKVIWRIAALPVGASVDLTIVTKATAAGTIENVATITGVQEDSIQQNNRAVQQKEVLALHIPNVITANGDGNNDQLVIEGLDRYEANEIIILNRWGNHVFEQKNYTQNWEGKGLSEGTYFYLLKIKDKTGRWQELKGYITLLRPK